MTVLRPQEQLRLLPKYSSGGWIISQNRWRPHQQDQFNLLLQSKTKHMDTQYKSVLCVQFPSIKKLSELTSAMIEKNDLYGQASLYFWFAWLRPDTLQNNSSQKPHFKCLFYLSEKQPFCSLQIPAASIGITEQTNM